MMEWSQRTIEVMHTQLSCKAYGVNAGKALDAACEQVSHLETVFSRFLDASEVSRINKQAGSASVEVSGDVLQVLQEAVAIGDMSGGLFDVTIAPLMDLWDFTHASKKPSSKAIEQALGLVDYRQLQMEVRAGRVGLGKPGMRLDLGGLAKGYAADCAKQVLIEWGIESAYLNLGGNVLLLGTKPDGTTWKVGIRHPRLENSLVGAISVKDVSVVTSGDYERFYIDETGARMHHIVDPRTGYPASTGLVSLTVVCPGSLHADALSTTLFLSGLEGCRNLLPGLADVGVFAIDTDMRGWITESLVSLFQPVTGLDISLLSV